MKPTEFETVTIWDRAIDVGASDLANFCESRDMGSLVFIEGRHPTVYVLRDIPNALAVKHLFNEVSVDMRRMRAFQMALTSVRNVTLRDGRELPEWRPRSVVETESGYLEETPFLVSQDEVNKLFSLANILDVGEVAHARAFLPPEIESGFLLPPTSRQCLASSAVLFAALVQNMQTDGEEPRAAAQAAPPSGAAGAEPGDAHAMV